MKEQTRGRLFAAFLSAAMLFSCLLFTGGSQVKAADETGADSRVYYEVAKADFEAHIDAKTAPAKEGYLFAGWVAKKTDGKGVAIKTKTDAVLSEEGVTITAKYIPAQLAGVACQVKANTYDEGVEKTELRMVSVVDNGTYQGFGFNLYKRVLTDAETMTYQETPLCQYSADGTNPTQTLDRYSGLYVYNGEEKTVKTPVDIFGAKAQGCYFTTARIAGIPKDVYDSCIFVIKPYWITADGTYVEGLGEYNRVSDGKNGIVNISVNIKDAADIAAGTVNIGYDTENYQFEGADYGRVFEQMKAVSDNGIVKCVGNVADIHENAENASDIYINLRFTKIGAGQEAGTSSFTVEDTEFCDKDAKLQDVIIEDVIY